MVVRRFDVYLVNLDPVIGREIAKARPAVIVSPDEMNLYLGTIIVAPMTTSIRGWKSRVKLRFKERNEEIALDQIRTLDKSRLMQRLGRVSAVAGTAVLGVLQDMFAES